MKNKTAKRLGTLILVSILLSCVSPIVSATEDTSTQDSEQLYEDVFIPVEVLYEDLLLDPNQPIQNYDQIGSDYSTNSTTPLPSSVDLSESVYFPPISEQGHVNSCTAFAAVYYQFTYEANKLNNIASTGNANIYSPSWPYYYETSPLYVDGSSGYGSSLTTMYDFLKVHGALRLSDNPYLLEYDPYYILPTDVEAMCKALKT